MPLSHNIIFSFGKPVDVSLFTTPFISQGARNWPFFTFIIKPVLPAANSKSVCRHRKAGICNTSTNSAISIHWCGARTSGSGLKPLSFNDLNIDKLLSFRPTLKLSIIGAIQGLILSSAVPGKNPISEASTIFSAIKAGGNEDTIEFTSNSNYNRVLSITANAPDAFQIVTTASGTAPAVKGVSLDTWQKIDADCTADITITGLPAMAASSGNIILNI